MLFGQSMSRWQAAQIHFLISVVIAAFACFLIIQIWYPGALFGALGGPILVALLVGVDVCLGPLMTLILFNPKKARKLIALDLSIIAVIQLSALAYGLHTAYVARPAFIVYDTDQFAVISANDMEKEWLAAAEQKQYKELSIKGPQWVAIRAPKNNQESSDQSFYRAIGQVSGLGVETQAKYYVPLSQQKQQLIAAAKTLDKLSASDLDKVLLKQGLKSEQVGWLPLKTRQATLAVLINKNNAEVITLLPTE